jgi:hypothetical protein
MLPPPTKAIGGSDASDETDASPEADEETDDNDMERLLGKRRRKSQIKHRLSLCRLGDSLAIQTTS